MILSGTVLVDAPRRVTSAAVATLAPGAEFALLGGRFRVVAAEVDEWAAVAVRGHRAFRLEVLLSTVPGGTLVTCSARWRGSRGGARRGAVRDVLSRLTASVRARAAELVTAPVVVGTAIVRGRTVLAQQRAYPAEAAGLWELPGGRVEPGESDAAAVRRECHEELGVDVTVGAAIGPDVALPGGKLLRVYRAHLAGDANPHPHDHAALRWLTAGQLGTVPWLPADQILLPALRRALRPPREDS